MKVPALCGESTRSLLSLHRSPALGALKMRSLIRSCSVIFIYYLVLLPFHEAKGCNKTIRTSRLIRSPRVTSAIKGKPLHCTYRIFKYTDSDKMFELNFKAFQIGKLSNASSCDYGYLQIIDNRQRSHSSGMYCGKLRTSRLFLSETDAVTLTLHVESYNKHSFFRVQSSVLPKRLAQERHKDLTIRNPGTPVPGTYCDRSFVNCPGFCNVQSPGYPGFYPRNVTCHYQIIFNESEVTIIVGGNYYDTFDVGLGANENCDHKLCSSHISSDCTSDYLQIAEGPEYNHEIIGRFCGKGQLPRIISKGNEIALTFVTSVAGTMQNDGFYLSIGTENKIWKKNPDIVEGKTCEWLINSEDQKQGEIQSFRHWYPANTRCVYKFQGQNKEKVWIQFTSFSATQDCNHQLLIYDGNNSSKQNLLGSFCKRNRPNETILSTGTNFTIEFYSRMGSYDGSQLEFSLLYLFISPLSSGMSVSGSLCDEIFNSENVTQGNFDFLRNRLRLRQRNLQCRFIFTGRTAEQVRLTFEEIKFNPNRECISHDSEECDQNETQDRIVVLNQHKTIVKCLCMSVTTPLEITTTESFLEIQLFLYNVHQFAYRKTNLYLFKGTFEFLQLGCGPSEFKGIQGSIIYPTIPQRFVEEVLCRWNIHTENNTSVFFKFQYLFLSTDCSTDRIHISNGKQSEPYEEICASSTKAEIFPPNWTNINNLSIDNYNRVTVELRTFSPNTRFKLNWNAVTKSNASNDQECDYLCSDKSTCIPQALVCNGLINCPQVNFSGEPLDEAADLCFSLNALIIWFVIVAGLSLLIVFALMLAVISYSKITRLCKRANQPQ